MDADIERSTRERDQSRLPVDDAVPPPPMDPLLLDALDAFDVTELPLPQPQPDALDTLMETTAPGASMITTVTMATAGDEATLVDEFPPVPADEPERTPLNEFQQKIHEYAFIHLLKLTSIFFFKLVLQVFTISFKRKRNGKRYFLFLSDLAQTSNAFIETSSM